MSERRLVKVSGAEAIDYTENSLRRLIIDGFYVSGERISDTALSNELGVSRTTIREAFQRLVKEGLISIIPNRGAFVTKLSREEITKCYEVREALEVHAVRLATEKAPVERLLALQGMLTVTQTSIVEHGGRYPVDLDFHEKIFELADNPLLSEHASQVNAKLRLSRSKSGFMPARAREAYAEHVAILNAMLRRDVQGAVDAMRKHVTNSRINSEEREDSLNSTKQILLKR